MRRKGELQQKILIILLGGIALGFSGSPKQYFRTLRAINKDLRNVNQKSFNRSVRSLCMEKLLKEKKLADGTIALILTAEGELAVKRHQISTGALLIKKRKKWDGRLRVVIFDIPEKKRMVRDIIREHLKTIGFKKLQQSVFVFPYPCEQEILALADIYGVSSFVRVMTVSDIDNMQYIKRSFSLI